ncbi:hypothetical protein ABPG74_016982 [Tetrahymena malaccensis]
MAQELIQNFEIRDVQQMLLPISSVGVDKQSLKFLADAQFAYGKVEKTLISSLTAKCWTDESIFYHEKEEEDAYDSQVKLNQIQKNLNEIQQRKSLNNNNLNYWIIKSIFDDDVHNEDEEQEEINDIKGQSKQIDQQFKGMQNNDDSLNSNYVCQISQDQIESEDFFYAECNSIFNQKCVDQYLDEQINKNKIQLKCPHTNFEYEIPQISLKEILNQEQLEAQQSLQQVSYSTILNKSELQEIKGQPLDTKEDLSFKNSQIQAEKISTNLNQIDKSDQDTNQSLQSKQLEDENDWNCEICYENMISSSYLSLSCDHTFHKKCLSQYFNTQISQKKFPINCPSTNCNLHVKQLDLKEVLSTNEFQKYETFCLQNYIDSNQDEISWCLTPNCEYAFILASGQYNLDCPKCMKSYCLNCKCEYHKDQTCSEYKISKNFTEDDFKLEKLAVDQKFRKCSNCKIWVEKNQGCDHMTCRCGYQFCYICGGAYLNCDCPEQDYLLDNHYLQALDSIYQINYLDFDDDSDDDNHNYNYNHNHMYNDNDSDSDDYFLSISLKRRIRSFTQRHQYRFNFLLESRQFQDNIIQPQQLDQQLYLNYLDLTHSKQKFRQLLSNFKLCRQKKNTVIQCLTQSHGSFKDSFQSNFLQQQDNIISSQNFNYLVENNFPHQQQKFTQDKNRNNNNRKYKKRKSSNHLQILDDFHNQQQQLSKDKNRYNNKLKYRQRHKQK